MLGVAQGIGWKLHWCNSGRVWPGGGGWCCPRSSHNLLPGPDTPARISIVRSEDNVGVLLSPGVLHVSNVGDFHEFPSGGVHFVGLLPELLEDRRWQEALNSLSPCSIHDRAVSLDTV